MNASEILGTMRGTTVTPQLPPLAAVDRYLPRPIDENLAPPSTSATGYMWPAKGVLTSGFGPRWGRMHKGIDIANGVGTPIYAAAEGVVERAGWNNGGYGYLVDIRHSDGSLTRYGHNSRILVQPGQTIQQGQQISAMGSTGFSTGPHLHFEVHPSGKGAVNPIAFLPRERL
ncbi:M23 family metallopeptidase [Tolypothrix campylonemoides]